MKKSNMKNHAMTRLDIRSTIGLALAFVIWSSVPARSAEPTHAEGMSMTQATMMDACKTKMEQKQQMKEDRTAQDARLTEQVAAMNRAPENKRVGLMAALLTAMVEQRIALDVRKSAMEEEMMKHMMQHMQMGKESMAQCPMMKDMKDMKDMEGMEGMKDMKSMKGMDHGPAGATHGK